jgi:gamma-glutamylcysteine synthetase
MSMPSKLQRLKSVAIARVATTIIERSKFVYRC